MNRWFKKGKENVKEKKITAALSAIVLGAVLMPSSVFASIDR